MTTTILTNSKPRKQLADQLDRLDVQMERHDAILDALAEGLNGAVAEAAREGTRLAVKDAVIELLSDPNLRSALHQASAPPKAAKPSLWARLRQRARDLAAQARALGQIVRSALAARGRTVQRQLSNAIGHIRRMRHVKRLLVIGLGVVTVAALVRSSIRVWLVAAVSSAAAAITGFVVQAGHWFRRGRARLSEAW